MLSLFLLLFSISLLFIVVCYLMVNKVVYVKIQNSSGTIVSSSSSYHLDLLWCPLPTVGHRCRTKLV